MIEMTEIHPHPTEVYQYALDDHCLVVAGGPQAEPKVWLSRSMIKWIAQNGEKLLAEEYPDLKK